MVALKKVRLQAYVEPELAQQITQAAREGHRPESWELEQLLRLGLQAKKAGGFVPYSDPAA